MANQEILDAFEEIVVRRDFLLTKGVMAEEIRLSGGDATFDERQFYLATGLLEAARSHLDHLAISGTTEETSQK